MAIWSKGDEDADAAVHAFTVGDDLVWDRRLAPYDLLGCLAHATMLGETGIVTEADAAAMVAGLRDLHRDHLAGGWTVDTGVEDVHTRIEELLTERIGAPAKQLHTGRSRNDQVLTAIRLWQKDRLADLALATLSCIRGFLLQARRHEFVPLPGYTHLQRAMPSSIGMFFGGHAQSLLEDLILLAGAWELADRCPLGSGAGYGVPLPLDRRRAADLLGFARAGGIATCDANGRGKVETAGLDALGAVLTDIARFAADMVFFTTAECGFFSLDAGITTGSSIMPQKRNPDVFELLRGRTARFLGLRTGLYAVTLGLPTGYSRDLQDTKAVFGEGLELTGGALGVLEHCLPAITPRPERIAAALTPDLFATDEAYRLVTEEGWTFRDAYRTVGADLGVLSTPDPTAVLAGRTHAGASGNLGLDGLDVQTEDREREWRERQGNLHATWQALLAGDPER